MACNRDTALCTKVHRAVKIGAGALVRPWSWTSLPGWHPSVSHRDSWSTMPAVIVDLCIWCCRLHDFPLSATQRSPSSRHEHWTVCQLKWRRQIPCKPSKLN